MAVVCGNCIPKLLEFIDTKNKTHPELTGGLGKSCCVPTHTPARTCNNRQRRHGLD